MLVSLKSPLSWRHRTTTDPTPPHGTNDQESNSNEVDPELKLPKISSLIIVITANLLLQVCLQSSDPLFDEIWIISTLDFLLHNRIFFQ